MNKENYTCAVCKKPKFAFITLDTEKQSIFGESYIVCVDCFKNKDVEEIIKKCIKEQADSIIKHHEDKIKEIKKRLKGELDKNANTKNT